MAAGQGRRRQPRGLAAALTTLAAAKAPTTFDFVELKAEDTTEVEVLLAQLGFTMRGRHRTKPVSLWSAGDARVVLNEQQARDRVSHVAAVGLQVPDAAATSTRAAELMAPIASSPNSGSSTCSSAEAQEAPRTTSSTSIRAPSVRSSSNSSSAWHYDGYGVDNAPVRLAAQALDSPRAHARRPTRAGTVQR